MSNIVERILSENNEFEGAKHLVEIEGLSDPKVCNFLNRLVAAMPADQKYLEIGTFKGLTLCSAAYGNKGKHCIACDKFRFWNKYTGWGFAARAAFYRNVERYKENSATVEFHDMKSLTMFRKGLVRGPIGVYFYDGDHSYAATRDNILAAAPLLANPAILLVDDWRDPIIQKSTRDAIQQAGLRIDWERWLGQGTTSGRNFWNGLGVFILSKP
ncbi:MAG: class I SAM-dependent methyltransferase [Polyangiaceae bacterium]|nr:class I SAM-dependent methyltransferase [Polyangiaceae bacterium]